MQGGTGQAASPLSDAWIYVRSGTTITRYRTDGNGRIVALRSGQDPQCPNNYGQEQLFPCGGTLDVYHSTGVCPIPDSELTACTNCFFTITALASGNAGGHTLCTASVPPLLVKVTLPEGPSLWLQLWEPEDPSYLIRNIAQGAALWNVSGLTVTENAAANTPGPDRGAPAGPQVRPRERGLVIQGMIDARATGAVIRILNGVATRLALLPNPAASASVQEINATLGTAGSGGKSFEAVLWLQDSAAAFGPVQILVQSVGISPHPVIGAFCYHLAGLQIALVDDRSANPNGQARGAVRAESDEVNVVDFLVSPQADRNAISGQTRARRMVRYEINHRQRPLSATNATNVLKPEMPMWMAECQLVGITRAELERLMKCRSQHLAPAPRDLQLSLSWQLGLSWDGPDSGTTSPRRYQYQLNLTASQQATLRLDGNDQIDGVDGAGQVGNAFTPAPAQIPFPIAGRRLPQVVVAGQRRAWGRRRGATSRPTLLIEWQPRIVNAGNEIMRGGDGELWIDSISIGGTTVHPGKVWSGTAIADPPANAHPAMLPRYRVVGINPPSPANAVIDALVEDYYNSNNTQARVTLLTLACWQETIRRILAHEAGHQFDHRGSGRRRFGGEYYGHEGDMPIFGAPHGYGYGQHDNPAVTDDGAWSFFENIKESVRRIMRDKAQAAYNHISGHLPSPLDRRIRAVYQREIVRRYNGGREFSWSGSAWQINPSLACTVTSAGTTGLNPRLAYPNNILGTNIVYGAVNASGVPSCSWPITFPAIQFGPQT